MGFGILLMGYFAVHLMSMHAFGSFVELLGYAIMLVAVIKLNRYNGSFKWSALACAVMLAVSSLIAAVDVSQLLYEQLIISSQPFGEMYIIVLHYIELAGVFLLHTAMLAAIRAIAIETGVFKNAIVAVRNLIFVFLYMVLYLLATTVEAISTYCLIAAVFVYFLFVILNLVLIYSCYARICDECDVDMEQKPSRFAFVNRMRAESEQRRLEAEEKRNKRRQSHRKK